MAHYPHNIPAHCEDYAKYDYQGEAKNTIQTDEQSLDWNSVFPSRYLAKHWQNLPEEMFPSVILKELGYIVKHVRDTESKFDYFISGLKKIVAGHSVSISTLVNANHSIKIELSDAREALVSLSKIIDETRLAVSTLQKELYLAKTYPVNGSAIRLSPVGARRKIRSHVKKGTGAEEKNGHSATD